MMVPGRTLQRFARFVLPEHICDQIVDAQLADFQHEWAQASSAHARALILIRGYLAFCVLLASCAVGMRGVAGDERRALRRVFAIALVVTALALTGVVMYAVRYLGFGRLPLHASPAMLAMLRRERLLTLADLVNQLLPFAVAFGLVSGIAAGLQRHASRASSRVVLAAAVISCVILFAATNWMMPLGIQSFRYLRAPTLGELGRSVAVVEQTRTNGPGTIRGAQLGYHLRWAWPFATFALGLFAISLKHRGRAVRIGLGIASCAIYLYILRAFVVDLVWTSHLPPILLAWLPNLVFVALSIVIMTMSRRPAAEASLTAETR
jgi:hypothetical protein